MKSIIAFLILSCAVTVAAQTPTPTPSPTPPPHKPMTLDWDDNPATDNVKWYNVYKKVVSLYVYQATVYVPSPSEWSIPLNTPVGTIFAVTADNGAQESTRSNDATVPIGPATPVGVKVIINF